MSNECRMTPEQFEALATVIRAGAVAHSGTRVLWEQARRLLVEPEQPKIHDGPCMGGPLGGSWMACGGDVFKTPGGQYSWQESVQQWWWEPEDVLVCEELGIRRAVQNWETADPADLTFGDLTERGWFELTGDQWYGDRARLLTENGVVYDEEGLRRILDKSEPVRRLPKPEWSK